MVPAEYISLALKRIGIAIHLIVKRDKGVGRILCNHPFVAAFPNRGAAAFDLSVSLRMSGLKRIPLYRLSNSVGPVCPQKLPDISNEQEALERMPKGRLEYLKRLLPHLRNQSEDCLYLNIYAPAMGEYSFVYPLTLGTFPWTGIIAPRPEASKDSRGGAARFKASSCRAGRALPAIPPDYTPPRGFCLTHIDSCYLIKEALACYTAGASSYARRSQRISMELCLI